MARRGNRILIWNSWKSKLKLSEYFTGFLCKQFENYFVDEKPLKRCAKLFTSIQRCDFVSLSLARSISTKCALLALHNWWQTLFYTRLCCIMIYFIDPFRKSWFASLRVCLWVWVYLSVFFLHLHFFPLVALTELFSALFTSARVWCTSTHVATLVSFVVSFSDCWCLNTSIQTVADCQIYLLN